jgi:hypothetical protein
MRDVSPQLAKLLAAARRGAGQLHGPGEPLRSAPAGFSRGVVRRWLEETGVVSGQSWEGISRRGLAWAAAIMVLSLLVHARVFQHAAPFGSSGSDVVVRWVLPR